MAFSGLMNTMQKKIQIPVNLIVLVMMIGISTWVVYDYQKGLNDMLEAKVSSLTSFLARSGANYMAEGDMTSLEKFAAQATENPEVSHVIFTASSGDVLVQSRDAAGYVEEGTMSAPVINAGGDQIGRVELGIDRSVVHAKVAEQIQHQIYMILLVGLGKVFLFI